MPNVVAVLLTLIFGTLATDVWAQCQTRALARQQTDQPGTLDASDCAVAPSRLSTGEYWTFSATAGEAMIVTMRRVTMSSPYLIILDPSNRIVASASRDNLTARATFTASTTGMYRAIATTFFPLPVTDYGTYTIRLELVTTPLAPELFPPAVSGTQVTVFWAAPISTGPILEYILEAGTAPGAQNIGVFSTGTATHIVATAVPGIYFVRVRARNAYGVGPPSVEQSVTVSSPGAPSAPRSLTASISFRRVTLSWLAPVTGPVTTYYIVVGSSPGASNVGVFSVGTSTSIVADVAPGVYYVRVQAANAFGVGPASDEVVIMIG